MGVELIHWLLESTLASSAAMVAVLLLRTPVQRAFGAGTAYALWLLVPAAWLATLLPAPVRELAVVLSPVRFGSIEFAPRVDAASFHLVSLVLPVWLAGVAVAGGLCWKRQRAFVRRLGTLVPRADGLLQASAVHGLPAVIGLRPRIVVPADFDTRYRDQERALILAHERIHARRGDLAVQALMLVLRTAYWFNPLVWLAAERLRRDQELACDASVVARHPDARRTYAEAMVKISLGHVPAPLACHWTGTHPLKERLVMLKSATPSRRTLRAGAFAVVLLTSGAGFAAWALQTPETRIAPSSDPRVALVPESTESGKHLLDVAIDLHVENMPLREAGREVETLSGVRILNPEALSARPVTFDFKQVSAISVLRILAEENGSALQVDGNSVRFVAQDKGETTATPSQASRGAVSRQPAPPYPAAAVANKQSGRVVLVVDVNPDGSVALAQVESSNPPGVFDAATLQAAKQWTFNPTMKNGKPVAGRVRVPVDFDISGSASDASVAPARPQAANRRLDPQGRDYAWVQVDARKNAIAQMNCDAIESLVATPYLVWCGNRPASRR